MLPVWKDFLISRGAVCDGNKALRFGDAITELMGARSQNVLADLSHFSVIEVSGDDAGEFLHGQFTNDVKRLDGQRAQRTGYCSPKGRLLATFVLWQAGGKYFLLLPNSLAEGIQKRLSMFVLRSKVKLADVSEHSIRLSVAGPAIGQALGDVLHAVPDAPMSVAVGERATVIGLEQGRYLVVTSLENAKAVWKKLDKPCHRIGSDVWDWLTIRAGIPIILPPTQEQFLPQMVNFEIVGGVDFKKGCYPGQEIVARTQYLGKLKRRMYRANISARMVEAGDELFSSDLEGQASGMIVNAAPSPEGGFDALAVVQAESAQNHSVHFQAPGGPPLRFLPLPYAVP